MQIKTTPKQLLKKVENPLKKEKKIENHRTQLDEIILSIA